MVISLLRVDILGGTQGLWELLTRNAVDNKVITEDDLKTYKSILELTNAHLEGYAPGGDIMIIRGPKFNNVISKLFRHTKRRGQWVNY
jgi:transposase-like protein